MKCVEDLRLSMISRTNAATEVGCGLDGATGQRTLEKSR
jgi:hypothetical protein